MSDGGLDLAVLGCATPYPSVDNPCSGYLVSRGDVRIWVDAPPARREHDGRLPRSHALDSEDTGERHVRRMCLPVRSSDRLMPARFTCTRFQPCRTAGLRELADLECLRATGSNTDRRAHRPLHALSLCARPAGPTSVRMSTSMSGASLYTAWPTGTSCTSHAGSVRSRSNCCRNGVGSHADA
jgi:hypothetical protein